jgi:predicted membrane-bound mannosyltransferase/DNA-binding beta-propeller fold protein YncE
MSHDESLHTYFSWTLSQGQGYQHNPMMHGPLQFHMVALSYFIFGANDFTARIPAVLFSIATVWVLWYWRRYLGRAGVIAAGIMMLLSPYMLYYGRYVRNESFVALFGVLTLYAVLRYLETGLPRYIYLLVAATVLHFTVKETSFIYVALLLVFLAGYLIARITRHPWKDAQGDFKGFLASLIIGALAIGSALLVEMSKGKQTFDAAEPISPAIPGQGPSPLAPIESGISPVLILGIIGIAAIGAAIFLAIRGYGLANIRKERSFDLAMVTGTLILPMLAAFPMELLSPYTQKWWGIPVAVPIDAGSLNTFGVYSIVLMMVILAAFVALAVWLGLFWNKNLWWKSALLFYSIFTVFYTTLFTNGGGFFTGLLGSLGYWIEQHGVERGSQPLYYYALIQVPIYEYLPALATIFAFIIGARQLQQAREQTDEVSANLPNTYALLGWWSFGSLAAFSIAGERMPWLTVHITLPFILFGGWAIGSVIERIDWDELRRRNALLVLALVAIFVISALGIFIALLGSPRPFEGMELGQLQATTSFIFAIFGALASGYGLFRLLDEWDVKQAAYLATLVFFGIFAILTARTTIRANYVNYDSGKEYLVYAHGYTGVKTVLKDVMALSEKTVGTPYDIVVAYDDDVSWPMSWYMIDFPNARFYGGSPDMTLREVPAIIVGDNNFGKIEPIVGENYYRFDYVRMVWPNQDYFNLVSDRFKPEEPFSPDYPCTGVLSVFKLVKNKDYSRVCEALGNPEMRAAIFDIWLNRDYTRYAQLTGKTGLVDSNWDPSDRMRLYIRKDVADLVWNYGIKAADLQPDPYADGMITLAADTVFGMPGNEPGMFNAPRGIAIAPDGSIYVADSRNHRIQHFDSDGQLINAWGSFGDLNSGQAPLGTFNEPWGVAVGADGSVYITDTWNHRVQKFSKDGAPLISWGVFGLSDTPGALYGPRGITVDAKGRVFVADTGNKRIVIFDSNGAILGAFGSEGYDPGQFSEPVDVKLDAKGNVYVTDTWNQRIQMLSPLEDDVTYIPVAQWPVRGWRSQNLENKPYLAVSKNGNVFITDPEGYRVIQFDQNGEFIQLWGTFGVGMENFGLASGIAVDSEGHVWVTDAGNGRVMRFTLP